MQLAIGQVGNRLTAMGIRQRRVVTLSPDMMVQEAVQVLLDHKITDAPVVNDCNKLVGVISETNLLCHSRESTPRTEGGEGIPDDARRLHSGAAYADRENRAFHVA